MLKDLEEKLSSINIRSENLEQFIQLIKNLEKIKFSQDEIYSYRSFVEKVVKLLKSVKFAIL